MHSEALTGPLFMDSIKPSIIIRTSLWLLIRYIASEGRDYLPEEHAEYAINELVEIAKTGKIKQSKNTSGVRE